MCFTPPFLWSILVYISFGQKLPIRTAHHTFLESRHPEVNKNPYYILFPEGSQKKSSAHVLILGVRESKCMEIQKFCSSTKPRKFLPLKKSQKKSGCMKFIFFTKEVGKRQEGAANFAVGISIVLISIVADNR